MIQNLLDSKGEDRILLLSGGPKSHLQERVCLQKDEEEVGDHTTSNRCSSQSFYQMEKRF